jgi:hypothetical protein
LKVAEWWDPRLENKPDFLKSMERIYAWYEKEIIDRPPVRFIAHNASFDEANSQYPSENIRDGWFDEEFQVRTFMDSIEGRIFLGETFPVYSPNLGPAVYAAFYGCELEFGEVTSWAEPVINDWQDLGDLKLDWQNEYLLKLNALTKCGLELCSGKFIVGYTDLHPGLDCAAAWRGSEQLCLDMIDSPDKVKKLVDLSIADFQAIYDHFDDMLKEHGQLSVSWMGIPSFGKMHIPSCDFSSLISSAFFRTFCLPVLEKEVQPMTHNVFHVDGKGVARHIDMIMNVPEVHAIQWVQGVGTDYPIMQWVPFIKRIQSKKPVIVDLSKDELGSFIEVMEPEGLFLWIATENEDEERRIIKLLEKW